MLGSELLSTEIRRVVFALPAWHFDRTAFLRADMNLNIILQHKVTSKSIINFVEFD